MQSTKQPDNETTRQQNNQTTKQPDSTNVLIILFFRIRMTIEENGQQSKYVFLYFYIPSILPNQQKPLCQRLLPLVINARLNDNQRHLSNPSWMMEKVFAIRALVSLYSGEVG